MSSGTTIILDGALNILEMLGSSSRLKINTEKTNVIWIGCKKYSKGKLNVTGNLDWGSEKFTLLGIEVWVD